MLKTSGEWWKHLRPDYRRLFWKSHRQAERKLIRDEKDLDIN